MECFVERLYRCSIATDSFCGSQWEFGEGIGFVLFQIHDSVHLTSGWCFQPPLDVPGHLVLAKRGLLYFRALITLVGSTSVARSKQNSLLVVLLIVGRGGSSTQSFCRVVAALTTRESRLGEENSDFLCC